MASFSTTADRLKKEAEKLNRDRVKTHSYPLRNDDNFWKQQELEKLAEAKQVMGRGVREEFADIVSSEFGIPQGTKIRKAVMTVSKGKTLFSLSQLTKAVKILIKEVPFIVFKPKCEFKPYLNVVFWIKDEDEDCCSIINRIESVKKEIAVDGINIKFEPEKIFFPSTYILNLIEKNSEIEIFNMRIKMKKEEDYQFRSIVNLICPSHKKATPSFISVKCFNKET